MYISFVISLTRPKKDAFKKLPLEQFTTAKNALEGPSITFSENIFTEKKPELVPDCPQIEDKNYWSELAKNSSNNAVHDVENNLQHVDHHSVDIDSLEKQQNTDLQNNKHNTAFLDYVESLHIDPVPPYVEPYELEMRKKPGYKPKFDCYYDTENRILSDEEDRIR